MLYIAINMFVSAVLVWSMWKFINLFKQAIKEFHLDSTSILNELYAIKSSITVLSSEVEVLKIYSMSRTTLSLIEQSKNKESRSKKVKDPIQSERMKQVWAERRAKKEQEKLANDQH